MPEEVLVAVEWPALVYQSRTALPDVRRNGAVFSLHEVELHPFGFERGRSCRLPKWLTENRPTLVLSDDTIVLDGRQVLRARATPFDRDELVCMARPVGPHPSSGAVLPPEEPDTPQTALDEEHASVDEW